MGRNQEFSLEMAFGREVRVVPLRVIHIQMAIVSLRLSHVAKWGREPLRAVYERTRVEREVGTRKTHLFPGAEDTCMY